MRRSIRRLPTADEDVEEIWRYIARDDEAAATRQIERIVAATNHLPDQPYSGSARPELGDGLRSVPVGRYIVYYVVEDESVLIVRVLHGARDQRSALLG